MGGWGEYHYLALRVAVAQDVAVHRDRSDGGVADDLVVFPVRADRAGFPQFGEALASRREVQDQACQAVAIREPAGGAA